ncbi:hypothetical protein C357_16241 [Citreicella sp. 357]|nr:hypothetical protein C357_16241 [Citreicella sp. 357]
MTSRCNQKPIIRHLSAIRENDVLRFPINTSGTDISSEVDIMLLDKTLRKQADTFFCCCPRQKRLGQRRPLVR